MDILQLREFKTIAELQSVSRAAEVLHVAQPSLSRTIKTLEAELNISLFERTGRNICLNENGKILLKYTNDILHSIDQMKMELSHANFQNLSVMPINFYAASALMPYIARQFHSRYPHIKLQLFSQKSSDLKRGALGRIAVFASARQEENENATLLLTERILAAVPAAHPLSVRKELCLKELQKENIISCTRGDCHPRQYGLLFPPRGREADDFFRVQRAFCHSRSGVFRFWHFLFSGIFLGAPAVGCQRGIHSHRPSGLPALSLHYLGRRQGKKARKRPGVRRLSLRFLCPGRRFGLSCPPAAETIGQSKGCVYDSGGCPCLCCRNHGKTKYPRSACVLIAGICDALERIFYYKSASNGTTQSRWILSLPAKPCSAIPIFYPLFQRQSYYPANLMLQTPVTTSTRPPRKKITRRAFLP